MSKSLWKKVVAIIKSFKLDEFKNSFSTLENIGITITEVKGFGRQKRLYRNLS